MASVVEDREWRWSAARHGAAGLLALIAVTGTVEAGALGQAVAVYLLFAAAMAAVAPGHAAAPSFGGANRITLVRLVMVCGLAGYIGRPEAAAVVWPLLGIAVMALLLDGVDGWWARRTGAVSDFGARFDMEVDALAILVLSALIWQLDKAGAWVVLSGALRYAFVVAGWLWSWLRRPLPQSERRRVVCAAQVAALVACLAPILPSAVTPWIAAAGLALTAWSFAVDVVWLYRQRMTVSLP